MNSSKLLLWVLLTFISIEFGFAFNKFERSQNEYSIDDLDSFEESNAFNDQKNVETKSLTQLNSAKIEAQKRNMPVKELISNLMEKWSKAEENEKEEDDWGEKNNENEGEMIESVYDEGENLNKKSENFPLFEKVKNMFKPKENENAAHGRNHEFVAEISKPEREPLEWENKAAYTTTPKSDDLTDEDVKFLGKLVHFIQHPENNETSKSQNKLHLDQNSKRKNCTKHRKGKEFILRCNSQVLNDTTANGLINLNCSEGGKFEDKLKYLAHSHHPVENVGKMNEKRVKLEKNGHLKRSFKDYGPDPIEEAVVKHKKGRSHSKLKSNKVTSNPFDFNRKLSENSLKLEAYRNLERKEPIDFSPEENFNHFNEEEEEVEIDSSFKEKLPIDLEKSLEFEKRRLQYDNEENEKPFFRDIR